MLFRSQTFISRFVSFIRYTASKYNHSERRRQANVDNEESSDTKLSWFNEAKMILVAETRSWRCLWQDSLLIATLNFGKVLPNGT